MPSLNQALRNIIVSDKVKTRSHFLSGEQTLSVKTCFFLLLIQEQNSPTPRVQSPAPPQVAPSSSPPTTPPPPHGSSPFRFTGQAQVHFSPSVLSPSPSPPHVSPTERLGSPRRAGGPQEVLLSLSEQGEVFSLEGLIPVRPEDQHSPTGSVSSEGERFCSGTSCRYETILHHWDRCFFMIPVIKIHTADLQYSFKYKINFSANCFLHSEQLQWGK